jgi:hypothetical protein
MAQSRTNRKSDFESFATYDAFAESFLFSYLLMALTLFMALRILRLLKILRTLRVLRIIRSWQARTHEIFDYEGVGSIAREISPERFFVVVEEHLQRDARDLPGSTTDPAADDAVEAPISDCAFGAVGDLRGFSKRNRFPPIVWDQNLKRHITLLFGGRNFEHGEDIAHWLNIPAARSNVSSIAPIVPVSGW